MRSPVRGALSFVGSSLCAPGRVGAIVPQWPGVATLARRPGVSRFPRSGPAAAPVRGGVVVMMGVLP
jgi:hypothetical protein